MGAQSDRAPALAASPMVDRMTARIVVTDPFAQRQTIHDVPAGQPLAAALMAISPSRWNGSAFELYDGAIGPAGAIEVESAPTIHMKDGDVFQVVVVPAEPISISGAIITAAGITSSIGIAAVTIGVYIAIMAITMAISFLATMLLSPGKQSNKALSSEDQPSGLNSLTPPRNTFRLGSRVAEIYGTMRFWPDLIFNATADWIGVGWEDDINSSTENPRTTSQQNVRAVYCLGRGHFQMEDFRFGDSPIATANGAVYIYPPGVPLPPSVTATYAVANLSRQEVGGPNSVNMWSPWYEIPADLIHSFDVQVSFPSGLINLYSGKKVPTGWVQFMVAEITIEAERIDETGATVETQTFVRPVRAKTRNELRITFHEAVTPGRWRVRMAETNDQQPYPNGNTETMIKKTALEGIVGHRNLSEAERTFAHETVLIVEANNIGGPAVQNMEAFNLIAHRMLPTQDVPGVMTEWRRDGRWITAAINTLTDPFLCNYQMSEVDWPSLHAVQASLDAYPEPFRESGFHAALDRQMTADEQLMLIARKARAQVFPSGGRMSFARDERRAGVSALFNRRNRLAGRTDIGMGLQFAGRDDPDAVVISFIDADNDYRQDTFTYPDGVTPASPLNIDLIGAVHKWEVCRRARFEMAQILYRRRSMPLRVTEEGQLLLPFDRAAVVMPWDEGVNDGEVLEVDGLSLRLSRAVPEGLTTDARIRLRASDGRQTTLMEVAADTGRGPDWVVLPAPPAFTILGPSDDRQIGTLYSLTTHEANDQATHWLMTGAEIDDQGVAITLMDDADEVYQLSDDIFDPCEDADPFAWAVINAMGAGSYDGGSITFTTPTANPGDILVVALGATGPNYTAPAGWTVLDQVNSAETALGEARSLIVAYRKVQEGDPTTYVFPRDPGTTLSGGTITSFGVNRGVGSIDIVGKTSSVVRATGPTFSAPGLSVPGPHSLVLFFMVSGNTVWSADHPLKQSAVLGTMLAISHFSWTPGVRPVYAATLWSVQAPDGYLGATGDFAFTIPADSNPLNNCLFTNTAFALNYDPSAPGTLVPRTSP